MATTQALPTGFPKKLLSLDGGGIKGVSSLMILQAIMKEVKRIEDEKNITPPATKSGVTVTASEHSPERRPIDYFDLTGGTSTGGIIAVMMTRLELNCTQAIKVYKDLASDIFAVRIGSFNIGKVPVLEKLAPLVLKLKLVFGSQYSAKYLDQSVDKIVNEFTDPEERSQHHDAYLVNRRYNPHDAKGKMLMCATMADRGKALLFRDYTPPPDAIPETGLQEAQENPAPPAAPYFNATVQPARKNDNLAKCLHDFNYNRVTIKDAVRATSAAPTYLPPEWIQKIQFWDGGLLNNNPIDQVWAARYDLTPTCHQEPYVSTIISLGCTYSSTPAAQSMGLVSRLIAILGKSINFATNTEAKHLDFKRNIYRRNLRHSATQQTNYFRFNVPVEGKPVGLADYKAMPALEEKTRKYLEDGDVKKRIHEAACLLVEGRMERHGTPQVIDAAVTA